MVPEANTPTNEARCAQLEQLNERSRWYTTQSWQVPFAYIGIAGVSIAGIWKDVDPPVRSYALWASGTVGALVFWHLCGVAQNIKRAVDNIATLEKDIGWLQPTVQYRFASTTVPFYIITLLAAIGSFVAGCAVLR